MMHYSLFYLWTYGGLVNETSDITVKKGRIMKNQVLVAAAAAAAIVTAPAVTAPVAAESVKVGYMQGFAGGRGIFGRYGFEGFELALDHLGGKLGGGLGK